MPEATEQPTEQAEKMYYPEQLSQAETQYKPYAVRNAPRLEACANCRWNIAPVSCFLVKSDPLPIMPTGWCNRWEALPDMEDETPMAELAEAVEEMAEMEVGTMARKPNVIERLQGVVKRTFTRPIPDDQFTAFKALGNGLWFATFSNNFLDRDGEIISEKAWDRYIARVQSGYAPMPELWLAHIRGTKHGQAHWVGKAGHMIYAAGKFDDTEQGRAAEKYYQGRKGDITMSHAFMYPVWAKKTDDMPDGVKAVYEDLTVFEITTLEPGEEANPFTDFKTLEELEAMPISDKERARIKDVFKDAADKVLANVETAEKAGEIFREIGTAYKSYTDVTDQTETAEKGAVDAIGAELLSDVLMAQGDAALALKGVEGKTLAVEKAANQRIAQLESDLAAVRKLLEMQPTAASEAASTVVVETAKLTPEQLAALPTEVKAMLEALDAKQSGNAEFDPFFGDLNVKKAR